MTMTSTFMSTFVTSVVPLTSSCRTSVVLIRSLLGHVGKRASRSPRGIAPGRHPGWLTGPPGTTAPEVRTSGDELLPPVDVVGRAGERRVGHEVDGERGDVGGADDPADRQRRPQVRPTLVEPV